MRHVGHDRLDLDGRVDAPQLLSRRDRFRHRAGHVRFVEQELPLQIVQLDEVAVDDPHEADARADEHLRDHRAERPATADQCSRAVVEPPLAFGTERGKANLAIVAVGEVVDHLD